MPFPQVGNFSFLSCLSTLIKKHLANSEERTDVTLKLITGKKKFRTFCYFKISHHLQTEFRLQV